MLQLHNYHYQFELVAISVSVLLAISMSVLLAVSVSVLFFRFLSLSFLHLAQPEPLVHSN